MASVNLVNASPIVKLWSETIAAVAFYTITTRF